MIISYLNDGLYPTKNIEAALRDAFGMNTSILDISHASSNGTLVGLPVATTDDRPSCRVFTNYNGSGKKMGIGKADQ